MHSLWSSVSSWPVFRFFSISYFLSVISFESGFPKVNHACYVLCGVTHWWKPFAISDYRFGLVWLQELWKWCFVFYAPVDLRAHVVMGKNLSVFKRFVCTALHLMSEQKLLRWWDCSVHLMFFQLSPCKHELVLECQGTSRCFSCKHLGLDE